MAAPSKKQRQILAFPFTEYDALICDGAIRSGKTCFMIISFVDWAMGNFNGQLFGVCGKTVKSAVKNVIIPFTGMTITREKYEIKWKSTDNILEVSCGSTHNSFEVFGGKDESSYTLVQGRTFAGVLFDEVALQPRSFVEQALGRCSVEGSKFWFNCNPENPLHWFRKEWILKAHEKNALHLHFLMDDNPSLSEEMKARYKGMFSGVFYQRYIEGLWVMAEGLIYDMFDQTENVYKDMPVGTKATATRTIAVDYGTTNPTIYLDIYDTGETVYVDREYRWDSREKHRQKTDEEYADDFVEFMGDDPCAVIVDPSAASFIAALQMRGVYVVKADNEVLDGIRKTGDLFNRRVIQVNEKCSGLLDELGVYSWDDKAALNGVEKPVKASDHAPDALRYYVNSLPEWRFE